MHLDEKKALSSARFLRAQECLDAARVLLDAGDYKGAANAEYFLNAVLQFLNTK